MTLPLLDVAHLRKTFPARRTLPDMLLRRPAAAVQAVADVSLEVLAGETLGIVGESGCGKSTLARCLVRLYRPDEGRIRYNGENVLAMGVAERRRYNRRVQMVFQDPFASLNPRMTVGAALGEALSVHEIVPPGDIPDRVRALLDTVHLPAEAAERRPHEFSGGQRQRIGIARALAVEPALIIADEPVSALDVSVQAQVINLFTELQERLGLALIFITHDLRLVRHLSHRLAVMYLGRIVETGPTQEVFDRPRHPYTQALIRSAPTLVPGAWNDTAATAGELPSPLAPPPGCPYHPRCPIAVARCRTDLPALIARGGGWPVACHLAGI